MKLNEALSIKTEKRIAALDESDRRRAELHARFPRVKEIDILLREIPMRSLVGESVEALRAESDSLSAERERILALCGYEKDFDVPKFECADCNDGGYCGIKLCHCVRELMTVENYRASSLAGGLLDKTFDSFSLSYYQGADRDQMETVLAGCKLYAERFPNDRRTLFLRRHGIGQNVPYRGYRKRNIRKGHGRYLRIGSADIRYRRGGAL